MTIVASMMEIARRTARKLIGQPCWDVGCGGSVGSSFNLALGKKIRRKRELTKLEKRLPKIHQRYEQEFSLLVWCTWRLSRKDILLVTSDDCDSNRRWCRLLKQLIDLRITDISVVNQFCDLKILFSNGYQLDIFCDHGNKEPSIDTNWELFVTESGVTRVEFFVPASRHPSSVLRRASNIRS
jgi:hypothetical protein